MAKVPSNVVRCECGGPIAYPGTGNPYRCERCGEVPKTLSHTPGTHWDESYGYLVEVDTEDDPRDTEEEIEDIYSALSVFADILGDGMTAFHVGGSFTCTEADRMATALMVGGHKKAAMTLLEGHADGDDDEDDIHPDIEDYEAYVLELAGKPVPELVEEPEPKEAPEVDGLVVISVDELLKLMNLD